MKKTDPKKPPKFWLAPDAAKVAEPIIRTCHPHLVPVRVEFVFTREPLPSKHGRTTLANAQKYSGLKAFLASNPEAPAETIELFPDATGEFNDFFVVQVDNALWRQLNAKQKKALIDHELCHCGVENDDKGNTKLVIQPHDLEEFRCIVERHGFWKDDVAAFAKSIEKAKRVDK